MKNLLFIFREWGKNVHPKTIRIMKLLPFLLFINILHICANVYSQNEQFTFNVENIKILDLLNEIESESDYKFLYRSDFLNSKSIDLNVKNIKLEELLIKIFSQSNISYKILNDKLVVLAPREFIQASQVLEVSGVVTNATDGMPIPGVNILIEGTTQGTVTDSNGKYSIRIPSPESVLVFSFIGFTNERFPVNNRSVIDVSLVPSVENLDEVVVIGYGTQRKKDLTGSIVNVDLKGQDQAAVTDLSQALQGHTAGLFATAGSLAGETGGLSIRGKTSLSASDVPLIVVDGIIFNGTTADLNINDIESIDILKDASAAAVYGSRSANGVIAITTKTGKSSKPLFSFNAYFGMQDLANTQRTHVMNGEEYAVRLLDYYYQQTLYTWYKTNPTSAEERPVRPDVTDKSIVSSYLRTTEEKENYLAGKETNWVNEVFRVAPIQSYNLSVSGQTNRTNYFLSSSYTDQDGILMNDNFKRLTFFTKFENKITDWLTVEFSPTFTHLDYSGLNVDVDYALWASPWGNKYNDAGEYPVYIAEESLVYHPLGHTLVDNYDVADNLNLVFKGKINVPWIKGLRYEVNYSRYYDFDKTYNFYPTTTAEGSKVDGLATKENGNENRWLLNNIFTYEKVFGGKHKINATYLYSRENLKGEGMVGKGTGFDNEILGYNSLELAETQTTTSSAYEENTISYMGRINYSYNSRYLVTATLRRDGFSGFGSNNKFGNFPSISLGWVASEESFLKPVKCLDFLKLRLSYGINGNQGIGRYASQAKMSSNSYSFDGTTAIGLYASSLGNSDLGWERTASTNEGLDISILNHRISANFDFYQTKTTDVLVERSVPEATGYSSVWTNIGGIKNHGLEITLSTQNIKANNFNWSSNFSFSRLRNKITKLYDNVTEDTGNSWFVGKPISAVYGYKNIGVWQEKDLFDGTIMSGFYPGQFKIEDLNKDGAITADQDRTILGYSTANYRFSIGNTFFYKNFTLNVFINSIQGGNGYYMAKNTDVLVAGGTDYAYRENRTAVRSYWRPDNPVNNAPAMYNNPSINPGVCQDKSYVRLQDVSLSYDIKKELIEKYKINSLQIYISGKNLYTWTEWSGWDPEESSPMIRSIIAGIKLGF